MTALTIIAHIKAKSDHIERVKTELEKLIPLTRNEAGCIQYDLHRDNEDPTYFLFYESWTSREQWQAHMHAPHIAAFINNTDGALDSMSINEMTPIG